MDNTLIPRWQKMNYAAPDMANMLMAMSRGQDAAKAAFAFQTLARMRETAPAAFDATFNPDEQRQVDFFTSRQNYYAPEDIVNQMNNRGRDQTVIQSESCCAMRRERLSKIIRVSFPRRFHSSVPTFPVALHMLQYRPKPKRCWTRNTMRCWKTIWSSINDKDMAVEATQKQIKRVWSTTTIGGNLRVARFPPEVAGYEPINGSFDWIDHAVRKELGLSGPLADSHRRRTRCSS